MKTTLDLPGGLMTEVKIEAARQKKKLKELVPELLQAGLRAQRQPPPDRRAMEKWLKEWVELGQEATRDLPPSPTATEVLSADRRRLERD